MLDKARDMYRLKKQATQLQKELALTIIEATSPDDLIKVEVGADQKIRLIDIDSSYLDVSKKEQLETQLKNVLSSAMTQSQQVAANKMKEIVDQLLIYLARSRGDADAFGRLYDLYLKDIYRFIYLKVGVKEVAQDLSSEAKLSSPCGITDSSSGTDL